MSVLELVARAGHLFALAIAPRVPSPEPIGSAGALEIAVGATALAVPPAVAIAIARRFGSVQAKVAVALWIAASIALVVGASRASAPLLASYYVAAPFVWAALAATAASLAGEYLGTSFRNKRTGAAVIVLAIGIFVYRDAHGFVASPRDQWLDVLAREPADARALEAVLPEADPQLADRLVESCIARDPAACACRLRRAERHERARRPEAALADVDAAACGDRFELRRARLRAVALAAAGADGAEAAAEEALRVHPEDATLSYALALVRDRQGRHDEALTLATRAAAGGAGHDAALLQSALLIGAGRLEEAEAILLGLRRDRPDDADVLYDLALVADRRGRYNEAREGYLQALKERPELRNARYNLALLTLRQGAVDEAKSHARRFREAWPDDPRGAELAAQVDLRRAQHR